MRAVPLPLLVAGVLFFSTMGAWTLAYSFAAGEPDSAVDPGWPLALSVLAGTVLLFPAGLALLSSKVLGAHLSFYGAIAVASALNGVFWALLSIVARKAMNRLLALRARSRSA